MKLSDAIRRNSTSLTSAQTAYQQNVVAVNTMVTGVLTSSLPTLNSNPPDWADFVSAYEQANSDALGWVNNVMGRLLQVPEDVKNYNGEIAQLLQDAQAQANTLLSNPGNSAALAALNADLTTLSSQMGLVTSFISGAITGISNFQNSLPDMATQLQTIATKSSTDAGADQQAIDDLLSAISALQSDIQSLTAYIIGLGIADAAALTIGTVATIALWPVGAVVWLVMGPIVAVATTYIALDAEKIVADKQSIQDKQNQITGITADVATLQILSTNFGNMATQATALESNLQAILAEWQTLEGDVNAAVSDIKSAIADAGSSNFQAVVNDLTDAVNEWNASYTQTGSLFLDLQVNNAQLQFGMSATDVQAAMGAASTVDIITYYNTVGNNSLNKNQTA